MKFTVESVGRSKGLLGSAWMQFFGQRVGSGLSTLVEGGYPNGCELEKLKAVLVAIDQSRMRVTNPKNSPQVEE